MGIVVLNRATVDRVRPLNILVLWIKLLLAIAIGAGMTGASSPAPSPPPNLQSGMEGSKAALVRIELVAVAEIAHIDHTTGDVEIRRGKSVVPLRSATGILLSADGIVATPWASLSPDPSKVAVQAANELFTKNMGVKIIGNNGDPARRGSTSHPYWAPHLTHCYDQVTHCVLFQVMQYHVHTYTSKLGHVMAQLLNSPSKPNDVALLRISGGGAAPTATLSTAASTAKADSVMLGFTKRPTPNLAPVELPTVVDAAAARIQSAKDLTAPLRDGLTGAPILDRATGQVLGLAGSRQPDGKATLVPAAAIRATLAKAGLQVSPSRFDTVFRRGIDHLAAGNQGGSAESALEESLTYFDSALAMNRLAQARALGTTQASGNQAAQTPQGSSSATFLQGPILPVLAGALLLAVIVVATVLLRRRAAVATASPAAAKPPAVSDPPASTPFRAVPLAPNHSRASVERTELTKEAAENEEPTSRGSSRSVRTNAGEHYRPEQPSAPASSATPPAPGPIRNINAGPKPDAGETRLAGPLSPRAASEVPAFCSKCGRQLQPEWRFCVSCGQRIG